MIFVTNLSGNGFSTVNRIVDFDDRYGSSSPSNAFTLPGRTYNPQ